MASGNGGKENVLCLCRQTSLPSDSTRMRFAVRTNMTGAAVKDSNMEENIEAVLLEDGMEIPAILWWLPPVAKPQMDFLNGTSIQALHMNYHIHGAQPLPAQDKGAEVNKGVKWIVIWRRMYLVSTLQGCYRNVRYMAGRTNGADCYNMCGVPARRPDIYRKNSVNFYGITMVSMGGSMRIAGILTHHSKGSYINWFSGTAAWKALLLEIVRCLPVSAPGA